MLRFWQRNLGCQSDWRTRVPAIAHRQDPGGPAAPGCDNTGPDCPTNAPLDMLHSVRVRFDPLEDRLELMIRVADDGAYQFHLTRRMAVKLASQLQILAVWSAAVPDSVDPVTRGNIAASHHTALAAQASFGPSPPPASPLVVHTGGRPMLVADVQCGRRDQDEKWLLAFRYGERETLSLVLQQATLHGIIELLRRKLKEAEWGLTLLPEPAPAQSAAAHAKVMH